MPIFRTMDDFAATLRMPCGLLALDVGEKTIGMAACDGLMLSASPIVTLQRGKFQADAQLILAALAEREGTGVVIGYPVNMNGTEGPKCQSVRQFANNLHKIQPLPILLWDERMSTQAVTRTMLEADLSRARRAEVVDKLAASFILQGVLDALSMQRKMN